MNRLTAIFRSARKGIVGVVRRHPWRLVGVGIVLIMYILYRSAGENMARQILRMRKQVQERRAEYLILRSEYLKATSQQAILNRARRMGLGLQLPDEPPIAIKVKEEEK